MPKRITERIVTDRESLAQPVIEPVSLCTTCDSVQTCVFFSEHQGAIQFCEEYLAATDSPASKLETASTVGPTVSTDAKGLCVNCQKLSSCVFIRPAEGIWHCEEYA